MEYQKQVLFGSFTLMKKSEKSPELLAISERLKEIRKTKGYANYEHISYDLGMSRSAYWRLESGENFSMKTLIKVCKVLDITFAEFFETIDLPKNDKKKSSKKQIK